MIKLPSEYIIVNIQHIYRISKRLTRFVVKMNTFITNSKSNRNLKNRLTELISKSKELKFLTGFFYFSGINELYESLKSKPEMQINILVGLNADQTIHSLVEYSYYNQR